jgi:hypothetical protein
MTVVAYLFVLRQATPIFHVAYLLSPALKLFRFPTRFLIVVELGLALARGRRRDAASLRSGRTLAVALAHSALIAADLRGNGDSISSFTSPGRIRWCRRVTGSRRPDGELVRAGTPQPRTFTPRHRDAHRRTFQLAHGWATLAPYFQLT